MTQKILGPEGSKRRKRFWLVPMLMMALAAIVWVTSAQAVHDTGRFQLDGDALSSTLGTPTATDDWDKVCYEVSVKPSAQGGGGLSAADAAAQCGINTGTTGPAAESSWVSEPDPSSS